MTTLSRDAKPWFAGGCMIGEHTENILLIGSRLRP